MLHILIFLSTETSDLFQFATRLVHAYGNERKPSYMKIDSWDLDKGQPSATPFPMTSVFATKLRVVTTISETETRTLFEISICNRLSIYTISR